MVVKKTRVFLIRFKNEISFKDVQKLRGAIMNRVTQHDQILFHNHDGDSFRYSYPLILYKRIQKKAAVLCINEGADVIGEFLSANSFEVILGDRNVVLEVETIFPKISIVQTWDSVFKYRINNWLALNSINYKQYTAMEGIAEKTLFLEKILIGNLLSFAKGVGIEVKDEILCKLISVEPYRLAVVKGVKMMSFNAVFSTNMSIPDYIGLGKHVSIGYGTVTKIYDDNSN